MVGRAIYGKKSPPRTLEVRGGGTGAGDFLPTIEEHNATQPREDPKGEYEAASVSPNTAS